MLSLGEIIVLRSICRYDLFQKEGKRKYVVAPVIMCFITWETVEELSSGDLLEKTSDNVNISHWISHLVLPSYSVDGQITPLELKSSYLKADV